MSKWTEVRDSAVTKIIEGAVGTLALFIKKASPAMKEFMADLVRAAYVKALSTSNKVDDTLVATIVAPLFGVDLSGVTPEDTQGVNAAVEEMAEVLEGALVESIKETAESLVTAHQDENTGTTVRP